MPAVSDPDDLPVLFSHYRFSLRLRSRAATRRFANRLRSSALIFANRARPASLALSALSSAERLSARARPPSLPSATACGFFLRPTYLLSYEALRLSRGKCRRTAFFSITQRGLFPLVRDIFGTVGRQALENRGPESDSRLREPMVIRPESLVQLSILLSAKPSSPASHLNGGWDNC